LKDEKVVSILATVLIHGLLLLLFVLVHINYSPAVSEFVEVSFASPAGESELPRESSLEPVGLQQEETAPLPESAPRFQEIELPERRQLALDEEKIVEEVQPEVEKKLEGIPIPTKPTDLKLPAKKATISESPFRKKEKQITANLFKKDAERVIANSRSNVSVPTPESFEIDWEGDIKREIYHKKLPEFPPDVQREATIKIKFTVLPNGLIGSTFLLQKGDTRLENLTLEAFRTWRFNPLPAYVEQKEQTGIITFHFKLK